MSSLQHPAYWSSHPQFTLPFIKALKHLSVWCRVHSEESQSCLACHALGSMFRLGSFQNHCYLLLSYEQFHTNWNTDTFLVRRRRMCLLSIQPQTQIQKKKGKKPTIYSVPAAHRHALVWIRSVNRNLTQAGVLLTGSADTLRCQRSTTCSCKVEKKNCQNAVLQASVDALCSQCSCPEMIAKLWLCRVNMTVWCSVLACSINSD